ncbi:MAG: GNAT family N-acetyltransferase [Deltaproteobacteria bacterium]|nr:MAG: GNAT family N-acetyltransferase [Deltaproteobacteria bacterium]
MPLTTLKVRHGRALADFLDSFAAAGETTIPGYFADRDWPIDRVVDTFDAWSRGEGLAEGRVPCTSVFLEEDGELLGLYNFRHHLTPFLERFGGHVGYAVRPDRRGRGAATRLLRGAMDFGRDLDLERLVLSCDPGNVASARVIEKCGGAVSERFFHEDMQREILLWSLPLA